MQRIVVTGANGVGKSHFAARLAAGRPDVPVVSFDAIKLTSEWHQKPRSEVDTALRGVIANDTWILEGGPSLLMHAMGRADGLVWLDPPEIVRAWRLAKRPWMFIGRTRPELPEGNVDWPLQQYRFALRSLRNRTKFRSYISEVFQQSDGVEKWRCRNKKDQETVVRRWIESGH
ncbi:MAG: DNA topology modulation protein FlaR [Sulfitobacter sp.]